MIPTAVVVSRFKHLCAIAALATAASCAVAAVPVITSQPQDLSVGPGDRAGFAITAPGATAYQWFRDGVVVPGATRDIIILPAATTSDAGSYSVNATNAGGTATSDPARLEIAPYTVRFVDPTFQPLETDFTRSDLVVVTSDSKILVGGGSSGSTPALERLTQTGSVDPTFTPAEELRDAPYISAIVPLPDGRVYVAAQTAGSGGAQTGIVRRLSSDGALDARFNAGTFGNKAPQSVVLQGDKVVVAWDGGLARLNPDGTHDSSFAYQPHLSAGTPISVTAWPGQGASVYVAGGGLLWRLLPNGSEDATFSPIQTDAVTQVLALPDSGVLYATRTLTDPVSAGIGSTVTGTVLLNRAHNDGTVDASFHPFTYSIRSSWGGGGFARFAVQPDGRILVAGDFWDIPLPRRTLLRLFSDGSLDTGFAPTDLPEISPIDPSHGRVVVLPGGDQAIVGAGGVSQLRRVSLVSFGAPEAPRILKLTVSDSTPLAGDDVVVDPEIVGPGPYQLSATQANESGMITQGIRAVLTNVQGPVTLVVRGPGGKVSREVGLTVRPSAPRMIVPPEPVVTSIGRRVRVAPVIRGSSGIGVSWYKDMQNAWGNPGRFGPITEADAGTWSFRASNAYGTIEGQVTITLAPHSELTNVSARATTGPGEETLILGFAIGGDRLGKRVMVSGVGSLARWGVVRSVDDPQATLYSPDGTNAFNDDTNLYAPVPEFSAYERTGAQMPIMPSKDSAIVRDLLPGSYTVKVNGTADTSGVVLANVFDADDYMGRIVNCSVRAYVGSGDAIAIPGFIIQGDKPKRLLIRGVGPTLSQFGVVAPLANPTLTVADQKTGKPIATNDDWGSEGNTEELTAAMASVGAFALPARSKDAAVIVTLPEGGYTVPVSGSDGGTGVALIEIYELP